tara:strand:- start:182 stop:331 length:150 start_codon:yes stop_codon:yes gene_type:complete
MDLDKAGPALCLGHRLINAETASAFSVSLPALTGAGGRKAIALLPSDLR